MKILFLVFYLSFFAGTIFAQDNIIRLDVTFNDDDREVRMPGATLEILQDGKPYVIKTSLENGRVPVENLPLNHVYTLFFKMDGFVTKCAEINAFVPYPEDLPPVMYSQMEISLFRPIPGVDFSLLENTPLAKFTIEHTGYIEFDRLYTKQMLVTINELKAKRKNQIKTAWAETSRAKNTRENKSKLMEPKRTLHSKRIPQPQVMSIK